ncbi:Carnosine n-methyltransferase [Thalictrum thalictroides]|uniref:carnosine N-methyltransferase n=1 Tax=Thalictrum thalictroides TaxID=46969 RepID=A0A7J6WES4_THATH|nr:Carnosine n-methyltransferase [Thalictrum thalictroides]
MSSDEQQHFSGGGGHLSHSKLEEALEVKSLRRIISAFLNYSDAAEEDVKRYKRSYRKLSPAHKALLSEYPLKCERLRRCISANSYFIMNMLQAFEPPLDMSQDIDTCECDHIENNSKGRVSREKSFCSGTSASTSGRPQFSEIEHSNCGEESNLTHKSPDGRISDQEASTISESVNGSWSLSPKHSKESEFVGSNDVKATNNQEALGSFSDHNGNENFSAHDWLDPSFQLNVPLVDVDKVRCIIRNIVRDWASEGWKERDQCYTPILEELDRLFPNRSKDGPPCCLVPGAGLGRLALEISCLGFACQGNEFSYYMMICSSFILNQSQTAGEWTIYPWIHSNCNSLSDNDQFRAISFPDIHPASAGITEGFSMCGGDFIEVYSDPSQEGAWDAVVTCFFLDTAHNIVEYIEIISKILKEGGVWINLGPLLYHFADAYGTEDEMSIELSLEDVKRVCFNYGFELEREKTIETTYTANPRSMMQNRYFVAFWTMRKKGML